MIKLTQKVDFNQAVFLSSKDFEPVLLLNYRLLKAIKEYDSSLFGKHTQLLFEIQNFALSKIKTIGCQCGHSALLGILKLVNLPSYTLNFDKLSKVSIKFFTPLNDLSYTVKKVDDFTRKSDSLYEGDFSKSSDPLHKIKVSASVDFEIELLLEKDISYTKPEKTKSTNFTEHKVLPVIEHLFRPRSNESKDFITPVIFSGAVAFTIFVLITLLKFAQANFNGLESKGTIVIGLFGGLIVLFYLWWSVLRII